MKILQRFSFFIGLSLLLPLGRLCAQVGGDNPTGSFGIFNGNVTTGCSYDPYTGNAMRSVPDISVAGAVGRYGLALSRTYNSRNGGGISFGYSGWRHSYEWTMDDSSISSTRSAPPLSYSVNFPDGRHETFTSSSSDIYFRAGAGIRERVQPLTSSMFAYLILPDGGYVEFKATQISYLDDCCSENCCSRDGCGQCTFYYYTYVAQAIVDPYGQITTLTYDGNGRLTWVTEPAGRTLQFYYVGSSTVVDHVTGSDGRRVQYNYSVISPGGTPYTALVSVVYYGYGDATWTANYQYRAPNAGGSSGVPLLWTCDDPMYPGPMRRIGYTYATGNNADGSPPVYGQILSENYYDGTNVLVAVTILSVNNNTRTEARADGHTRTFTYTNAMLTSATDFRAVAASQGYDSNGYINLVTDRNGHATNFTCNALTGGLTQVIYPLTSDTPDQTQRPTVTYTYGWAGCPDPNNQDANNPYYLYSVTDEGGHATVFTRDANKRVTRIDYPDSGYETFAYNSFGQVTIHSMTTGGTEYFTYDSRGLKLDYRDPDHTYGTQSARYQYDGLDRLSGVTDALGSSLGDLNHTMSYAYNSRGQLTVTTFPTDPIDSQRHTVSNAYNPDGTLASTTDQLSHTTSFTYDDYRRPSTLTTPQRFAGDNTPRTTYTYYGSGTGNDYTHTDSNVTHVILPSGNRVTAAYDANLRKTSVTVGDGTGYAATTSYGYDNVGNVTSVVSPNEQPGGPYYGQSTVSVYDERNRLMSVWDALNNPTSFQYDTSGRKKTVTRANGQVISYDSYDPMNRLLQQTVTQAPNPDAVTRWTWFPSGSMNTMVDPRSNTYTYAYDYLKRPRSVTYPPDSGNAVRTETYTYDTVGNLATFQNRAGNVQTFQYDNRNRETRFDWTNNAAVSRTLVYDPASNMTWCNNGNAAIAFTYNNDNTLASQEEWTSNYGDNNHRIVTYTYDPDGHRATMQYPSGRRFNVGSYTPRDEPQTWYDVTVPGSPFQVYYTYDASGNRTHRYLNNWQTQTDYTSDALNRTASVLNTLQNTYAIYSYAYDQVSNRRYERRNGGTGDGYSYDLSGQVSDFQRDGTVNSDGTVSGGTVTLFTYDESGNREAQWQGGTTTYTANNLNQYSAISGFAAPTYDNNGNLQTYNNWYYTYDAQNRLTGASNGTTLAYFWYDGLNRQCTRTINGNITFSVWDGWDLAEEYQVGNILDTSYMHGAGSDELVSMTRNGQTYYFFQDGLGSTSQLANSSGNWVESYSYDLHGRPSANSNVGNRFLFTGREWYAELGLYNYRNRFYHPDLGRFLQPDPIGFGGDPTNLYRYCGNNPVKNADPFGTNVALIAAGPHNFVGVTTPGTPNGMTYFDFSPKPDLLGFITLELLYPGRWQSQLSRPQGYQYATFETTPEEDARVLAAFKDRVQNQGDWYSALFNNCFQAPIDVLEQTLDQDNSSSDGASDPPGAGGGSNLNYITLDHSSGPLLSKNQQGSRPIPRAIGVESPGGYPYAYGFPMGSAPWGYGQNPYGVWGNAGNFNVSGESIDARNQALAFADISIGAGIWVMEPGDGPGSCFVAGTPVLMADGSEKPIESIQVGEAVLAWNEETRQIFSTKVVSALHHEEKMQTLFDIELDDGRKFTVNNDHPMFVVEDGDFTLTDELAARFAKGEPITFQDNNNQPIKIASLRMRRQRCKVYNLHVEGQGKKGHTYYANGILVHNNGTKRFK